jgi:phage FluMu protein Com
VRNAEIRCQKCGDTVDARAEVHAALRDQKCGDIIDTYQTERPTYIACDELKHEKHTQHYTVINADITFNARHPTLPLRMTNLHHTHQSRREKYTQHYVIQKCGELSLDAFPNPNDRPTSHTLNPTRGFEQP